MPLYKYVGNRILTVFENRALGMRLTVRRGYRAYSLHALKHVDFTHMTDDFHFDTEIIIKLHHQRYRIHEVPIPTYYGDEICYVNGMRYARDVYELFSATARPPAPWLVIPNFANTLFTTRSRSRSTQVISMRCRW